MTINIKHTIQLNGDEYNTIEETQKILEKIIYDLDNIVSCQIDDQIFDEAIEKLIKLSLQIESKRIFSRFDEETKEKIRKSFID